MRLLIVSHYYASHRGGVEITAQRLAEELVHSHGMSVTWVASATPPPEPTATPRIDYRAVSALNASEDWLGVPYPLWGSRGLRSLWREVRCADAVLVEDAVYMGSAAAALMARRLGKPLLVVQHIGFVPYRNPLFRLMMRAANWAMARSVLEAADQVVFISEAPRRYFSERVRLRHPARTIFNGVDTELFKPASDEGERQRLRASLGLSDEGRVFLFVGRFVEKKGLRVLRRLVQRFSESVWILAGWGPIDPRAWGLSNVRVEGGRRGESLASLYRVADLLVLPSVGEGFPLVIQEAMACGTPVLCASETADAAPDARDLLFAEAVYPFDAEATAELWGVRIDALCQRPETLVERRPCAADFARRRWSWTAAAAEYARLLHELASRNGAESGG